MSVQPLADAAPIASPGLLGRLVCVESLAFLGLWVWFLVDGRSRFLNDNGVFWHTVVGERILATGRFPVTDDFSFTRGGEHWIAWEWLAGCVLAGLHRLAGFDGIVLGTATLLAALYAWLVGRIVRAGSPWWLALFVVALAIKASSYHFFARPHLLTIVLLAWTVARLIDFEAGRIPLRGLVWLVPAYAVWASAHGGVLGGIGTVAVAVVGWAAAKFVGWPNPLSGWRQLLALGGIVLECAAATLVNPYGTDLPRVWFGLMTSSVVPVHIVEHRPLIQTPNAWPVLLYAGLYFAALAGVTPRSVRVTWLLPLVWLALAWSRVRHGPLFAAVTTLVLAEMLPTVGWANRLSRWVSESFSLPEFGRARPGWATAILPALAVVGAVAGLTAGAGRGWARLDPRVWPVELLPELTEYAGSRRPGMAVFNVMKYGGFLIYHTPGLRVFIDDRCELYGDDGILEFIRARDGDTALLNRLAGRYGFDRALVLTGSPLDVALRTDGTWRVVRVTAPATLFERVGAAPPAVSLAARLDSGSLMVAGVAVRRGGRDHAGLNPALNFQKGRKGRMGRMRPIFVARHPPCDRATFSRHRYTTPPPPSSLPVHKHLPRRLRQGEPAISGPAPSRCGCALRRCASGNRCGR